jgi:hypothetical protein
VKVKVFACDDGTPTVPCDLCGEPTFMTGTRRCDPCWELERRITWNPDLAVRILRELRPQLFKTFDKPNKRLLNERDR